jgi:hypothetical protein
VTNEIAKTDTGMSLQQREEMLRDDGLGNLKLVHGIMLTSLQTVCESIKAGDYIYNGYERIPAGSFGPGFKAEVLADRPRALLFEGNNLIKDSYDPKSPEWKDIAAKVGGYVKGAKVGAEVLLWLPDNNVMACFLVANKERFTIYPRFLKALNEKKLVQVTSGMKPGKNGMQVFSVVNIIEPTAGQIDLPRFKLEADRRQRALTAFDSYKTQKTVGVGNPQR